jgi:hypothetical protein
MQPVLDRQLAGNIRAEFLRHLELLRVEPRAEIITLLCGILACNPDYGGAVADVIAQFMLQPSFARKEAAAFFPRRNVLLLIDQLLSTQSPSFATALCAITANLRPLIADLFGAAMESAIASYPRAEHNTYATELFSILIFFHPYFPVAALDAVYLHPSVRGAAKHMPADAESDRLQAIVIQRQSAGQPPFIPPTPTLPPAETDEPDIDYVYDPATSLDPAKADFGRAEDTLAAVSLAHRGRGPRNAPTPQATAVLQRLISDLVPAADVANDASDARTFVCSHCRLPFQTESERRTHLDLHLRLSARAMQERLKRVSSVLSTGWFATDLEWVANRRDVAELAVADIPGSSYTLTQVAGSGVGGTTAATPPATATPPPKFTHRDVSLPQFHELRVFNDPQLHPAVQLLSGSVELFGSILVPGSIYAISELPAGCVFALAPSNLRIYAAVPPGTAHSEVVDLFENLFDVSEPASAERPYVALLAAHAALNAARHEASERPICLVIGDSLSSLAAVRTLSNWAVRCGRTPTIVDLDPSSDGIFGPVGSIGATIVGEQIPPEASLPYLPHAALSDWGSSLAVVPDNDDAEDAEDMGGPDEPTHAMKRSNVPGALSKNHADRVAATVRRHAAPGAVVAMLAGCGSLCPATLSAAAVQVGLEEAAHASHAHPPRDAFTDHSVPHLDPTDPAVPGAAQWLVFKTAVEKLATAARLRASRVSLDGDNSPICIAEDALARSEMLVRAPSLSLSSLRLAGPALGAIATIVRAKVVLAFIPDKQLAARVEAKLVAAFKAKSQPAPIFIAIRGPGFLLPTALASDRTERYFKGPAYCPAGCILDKDGTAAAVMGPLSPVSGTPLCSLQLPLRPTAVTVSLQHLRVIDLPAELNADPDGNAAPFAGDDENDDTSPHLDPSMLPSNLPRHIAQLIPHLRPFAVTETSAPFLVGAVLAVTTADSRPARSLAAASSAPGDEQESSLLAALAPDPSSLTMVSREERAKLAALQLVAAPITPAEAVAVFQSIRGFVKVLDLDTSQSPPTLSLSLPSGYTAVTDPAQHVLVRLPQHRTK